MINDKHHFIFSHKTYHLCVCMCVCVEVLGK